MASVFSVATQYLRTLEIYRHYYKPFALSRRSLPWGVWVLSIRCCPISCLMRCLSHKIACCNGNSMVSPLMNSVHCTQNSNYSSCTRQVAGGSETWHSTLLPCWGGLQVRTSFCPFLTRLPSILIPSPSLHSLVVTVSTFPHSSFLVLWCLSWRKLWGHHMEEGHCHSHSQV